MNQFQNKFLAFIESACSKMGQTDIIGPLQEGFKAICEAEEQTKSFDIPGVKVLSQTRDSNFGRYVSDAGLDSVRYIADTDGKFILPKQSNPNYAEYYYLKVEGPDGKTFRPVIYVANVPPQGKGFPKLDGISQYDGFIFIATEYKALHIYKDGKYVANSGDTVFNFHVPELSPSGKVTTNEWDDRLPPTDKYKVDAGKLKEATGFIMAEYDRLANNEPVAQQVDRDKVRVAVGNFFYNKFEDVVDYCERNGYSTDATIMKVKRAVNDDYYTDDPGAVGGQTLEFPEAGLSEER
jgi:hypothetical protein